MVMTFHEARNELVEDLKRRVTEVIEDRKHKPNYYILVASQVDNMNTDIIRNKLILIPENKKPEPAVGTILFFVDNRKGEMIREWVLPRDVIQPDSMINQAGDYSDEIFHFGEAPNR